MQFLGWTLGPPLYLIIIFSHWQKERYSHQLHSESESVGEGIAFGDAVHLVHAFLKLFQRFFLLVRKRAVQFLTIPGDQFQQFFEPLVTSRSLLEGRDVSVP